jgi:hypothetical protein
MKFVICELQYFWMITVAELAAFGQRTAAISSGCKRKEFRLIVKNRCFLQ